MLHLINIIIRKVINKTISIFLYIKLFGYNFYHIKYKYTLFL